MQVLYGATLNTDQSPHGNSAVAGTQRRRAPPLLLPRARARVGVREAERLLFALAVLLVDAGSRGERLALVLGAELRSAVEMLSRRREAQKGDLPDLHTVVERDGQVGDVAQLQRQLAPPARVDVARRRVDEQADAPERRLAL